MPVKGSGDTPNLPTDTWEDHFSPIMRRLGRVTRLVQWQVKGGLGWPRRMLIELRWRLGDEIMALPLYDAVKQVWPDCAIEVWCTYPELLDGHPSVDCVNGRGERPDRYVFLRDDPRDRPRIAHYAARAGVPVPQTPPRLCFNDWTPPPGLLPDAGPWAAVSTGATWPTKRWPMTHWDTLCRRLRLDGYCPVQVGLADDEPIPQVYSLLGKTHVADAARVLHACTLFVGCDSGLLHLARAADTPAIGLFGPTRPEILFPYDTGMLAVRCPRSCQGCWNDLNNTAAAGVCPKGIAACLGTLDPEAVAVAAAVIKG